MYTEVRANILLPDRHLPRPRAFTKRTPSLPLSSGGRCYFLVFLVFYSRDFVYFQLKVILVPRQKVISRRQKIGKEKYCRRQGETLTVTASKKARLLLGENRDSFLNVLPRLPGLLGCFILVLSSGFTTVCLLSVFKYHLFAVLY